MDACCERIIGFSVRVDNHHPSLAKLVEKTGLARLSVMMHLKHLERESFVVKEEIPQGAVGRPKMLYKPTSKLLERSIQTKSD